MVLIISCYRCKTPFCREKVHNNTIDNAIKHDNDDILFSEYPPNDSSPVNYILQTLEGKPFLIPKRGRAFNRFFIECNL